MFSDDSYSSSPLSAMGGMTYINLLVLSAALSSLSYLVKQAEQGNLIGFRDKAPQAIEQRVEVKDRSLSQIMKDNNISSIQNTFKSAKEKAAFNADYAQYRLNQYLGSQK